MLVNKLYVYQYVNNMLAFRVALRSWVFRYRWTMNVWAGRQTDKRTGVQTERTADRRADHPTAIRHVDGQADRCAMGR